MAKFYSVPVEIGEPPSLSLVSAGSFQAYDAACKAWVKKIQDYCRENGQGALAGEKWDYPVADGHAQYVVFECKPLSLIHLPIGDAWHVDKLTARGLRISDIKEQIAYQKRLNKLFAQKKREQKNA